MGFGAAEPVPPAANILRRLLLSRSKARNARANWAAAADCVEAPLQDADLLLTIAEVAVAFAGFASLVSILGQRSARDDFRVSSVRMRAMVLYSLLVVAFALFPFVFNRYGLSDEAVWRVSSALFAIAVAAVEVWLIRRVMRLHALSHRTLPVLVIVIPTLSLAGLTLLANATIVPSSLTAAVYLTGLGLLLFLAGLVFALILFSFLARVDSDE